MTGKIEREFKKKRNQSPRHNAAIARNFHTTNLLTVILKRFFLAPISCHWTVAYFSLSPPFLQETQKRLPLISAAGSLKSGANASRLARLTLALVSVLNVFVCASVWWTGWTFSTYWM